MKTKRLIFVLIALLGIVTACYKEELAALHNQIDNFTSVRINPIETQVERMSESLETLRNAHSALQSDMQSLLSIKTVLEQKLSAANLELGELLDQIVEDSEAVETLKAEKESILNRLAIIEQAIKDLEAKDTELEKRIAELEKFIVESSDSTRTWAEQSFANLKEYEKTAELVGTIAGDLEALKAALSASIGDISTSFGESIFELEQKYRGAIEEARQDLEKLMDDKDLVVRNWVLDTLDSGYYDMAATEQLLADLKAGVVAQFSEGDTILLRKIEAANADLSQVKIDYQEAIEDAINGIDVKIADLDSIRATLHKADSTASATASALTDLTGRVKTLEEQATKMREDIDSLKKLDTQIQERLKEMDGVSTSEFEKLKKADTLINNTIKGIQDYLDSELRTDVDSWVSQTYATLDRQNDLADSLAVIYSLLGLRPDGNLGAWVSHKFDDYLDKAEVMFCLDTLGVNLRQEMTIGFQSYIAAAIEQGGAISGAISDSLTQFRNYVNDEFDALKDRLTALENVVQSVVFVPDYDDGRIFIPSEYEGGRYINTNVDITLRYKINTNNASFDPNNYTITGDLVEAMASTKASYAGTPVEFTSISYANSILSCTFNTEILSDSFYDESKSAAISLNISDGKTDISSAYVGLRRQGSGSGTGGGGGETGGGDEPTGDVFRVNPSAMTIAASGGNFDGRITCLNDYTWLIEGIEYSSGSDWVKVEVLKDAERNNIGTVFNPNFIYYYTGYADIVVVVDPYVGEENRTATVTFTHGSTTDNPVRITMTITQNGRPEQDLTIDPDEIISEGMEFDWQGNRADGNGLSYKFTVIPSDQMYDYSVDVDPIDAGSWVNITRERLNNGAALVTVTTNAREKGYDSYYRNNHEANIVVTSRTGGSPYRIPVKQLFHPKSNLSFDPASLEMKFDWDDGADERQFITITPDDQLPNWSTVTDPAGNAFNMLFTGYGFATSKITLDELLKNVPTIRNIINSLVGDALNDYLRRNYPDAVYGKDSQTGVSMAYVYPTAKNRSFDSEVTAKITFTSAAPVGTEGNTYTLNITQGKRPLQELKFDKSDTQVDFDWDGKIAGSQSTSYVIRVSPSDSMDDWFEPAPDVTWIHISRGRFEDGNAADITITVDKCGKLEGGVRTGNVTFKSADGKTHKTLAIRQIERLDQTLDISGSPDENYILSWNDKGKYTLTVTPSDNQPDWTCEGDDDFKEFFSISGEGARNANGVGTITVGIKTNNTSLTANRTGKLTFTSYSGSSEVITFTQTARPAAQTLNVDVVSPDDSCTFDWKDSKIYTIKVDPSDDAGDWTCEKGEHFDDYFSINGDTRRDENGNGTIVIGAKSANSSRTEVRQAQISFVPATEGGVPTVLTFKQNPCNGPQTFTSASPASGSSLVFKKNGKIRGSNTATTHTITVSTSDTFNDWVPSVEDDADWIEISKDNNKLNVSVNSENTSGEDRSGVITITSYDGGASLTYTVTQAKNNLFYSSLTTSTGEQTSTTCSFTLYSNSTINGVSKIGWEHDYDEGGSTALAKSIKMTNGGTSTTNKSISNVSDQIKVDVTVQWSKNTFEVIKFTLTAKDDTKEVWKFKVTSNNASRSADRRYTFEPLED